MPDRALWLRRYDARSGAAELVFDADDIVLAEIGAGLHFDQLQHDLSGVAEPMHAAERQVDRLVLREHYRLAIARHLGRAAHHYPVLGAMMVTLQAEALAGFHEKPLHLEAVAAQDRGIAAPWAIGGLVDLGELGRLGFFLERLDDGAHP